MYSLSKTTVAPDALHAIVDAHFAGRGGLAAFDELKDGYFNAAYRLELGDGTRCVLKVAPPKDVKVLRYERDIMRAEVEVMQLVREHTGVPVPQVLCYDNSRSLVDSDFFAMAYLPGVPFNQLRGAVTEAERAAIQRQMGGFTRQINAIHGTRFGYYAQADGHGLSWGETFARMLDGLLLDGEEMHVVLPVPYTAIRERVASLATVFDDVQTPQLVHWDLWDGNVFVNPATKQITGLVDFERALWGDPLMEAAFGDLRAQSPYMEGYGRPMLDTPAQRCRRLVYNIYLYLVMIIEVSYRRYETDAQEKWARQRFGDTWDQLELCVA